MTVEQDIATLEAILAQGEPFNYSLSWQSQRDFGAPNSNKSRAIVTLGGINIFTSGFRDVAPLSQASEATMQRISREEGQKTLNKLIASLAPPPPPPPTSPILGTYQGFEIIADNDYFANLYNLVPPNFTEREEFPFSAGKFTGTAFWAIVSNAAWFNEHDADIVSQEGVITPPDRPDPPPPDLETGEGLPTIGGVKVLPDGTPFTEVKKIRLDEQLAIGEIIG